MGRLSYDQGNEFSLFGIMHYGSNYELAESCMPKAPHSRHDVLFGTEEVRAYEVTISVVDAHEITKCRQLLSKSFVTVVCIDNMGPLHVNQLEG